MFVNNNRNILISTSICCLPAITSNSLFYIKLVTFLCFKRKLSNLLTQAANNWNDNFLVALKNKVSDAKGLVYISTEYNRLTIQSATCVSDYNNKYKNLRSESQQFKKRLSL